MRHQISTLSLYKSITNNFIFIIGLGNWLLERELTHVLPIAFKFGYN